MLAGGLGVDLRPRFLVTACQTPPMCTKDNHVFSIKLPCRPLGLAWHSLQSFRTHFLVVKASGNSFLKFPNHKHSFTVLPNTLPRERLIVWVEGASGDPVVGSYSQVI